MATKLLIVESPNKVKKIQSILEGLYGAGVWAVAASVGHVRDLPLKELGIDRTQNYKMSYLVSDGKQEVVNRLMNYTKQVGAVNVFLATDPDREGESIAWHLSMLLGIDTKSSQRVTFQEITGTAIKAAITAKRPLNMDLVRAQEGRRAIDRLAGYEISDVLTKKTGEFLTAGRVQSVAVKLVDEREKLIDSFTDKFSYKLTADFLTPKNERIRAQYVGASEGAAEAINSPAAVQSYLASVGAKAWKVLNVTTQPTLKKPGAAFTTSTLQQEAIRKLSKGSDRWSTKRVMEVAQNLFASGHITYMRTDSPNLSEEATLAIQQQVLSQFGERYFEKRRFPVKADAQEAHEAIRPTHMETPQAGNSPEEQALYRLIYTRAMASQMKAAEFEQTVFTIGTGQPVDTFQAKASVLKFDGYRAIYADSDDADDKEEEAVIAPVPIGTALKLQQMQGKQTYRQPPKRYDEAGLVKEMEAKGIGRPSTYASILGNIVKREYILTSTVLARKLPATVLTLKDGVIRTNTEQQSVGGDKDKLIPSMSGKKISAFMNAYFPRLVDYAFTAKMEKQLDEIVDRKARYLDVITGYDTLHQASIEEVNERVADMEKKTVTRLLGEHKNKPVRVGTGPKGTYLIHNDQFYNVPDQDAQTLTLAQAIPLLVGGNGKTATASAAGSGGKSPQQTLHVIGKYEIKKGAYGYYFTDKTNLVGLPKAITTLTQLKKLKENELDELLIKYLDYKKNKAS